MNIIDVKDMADEKVNKRLNKLINLEDWSDECFIVVCPNKGLCSQQTCPQDYTEKAEQVIILDPGAPVSLA